MISRNSDKILRKSRRKTTDLRRFQQHSAKISKIYRNFANFRKKSAIFEFKAVQRYVYLVDLEKCFKNEYLVAKIGLDTAENEPSEKCAFGCCYNNLRPTLCTSRSVHEPQDHCASVFSSQKHARDREETRLLLDSKVEQLLFFFGRAHARHLRCRLPYRRRRQSLTSKGTCAVLQCVLRRALQFVSSLPVS